MTASPRRRSLATVALLVAIVGAACGVPTDGAPRDLAADRLPDALLPEQTTSTTTAETADDPVVLTVYFVDADQFVRPTSQSATDDSPSEMIAQLQQVPDQDRDAGLRTLITPDVSLVSPTRSQEMTAGRTLRLPLSDDFYALEGRIRSLAAAQLVFTITATGRFDAVLFVDGDDEPQLIPTSESELPDQPRPMTRQDFSGFNPLLAASD